MTTESEITASPIETIQLVALQRVSGHTMSRVDFENEPDAIAALEDLERFGHAGYVLSRGRIVSVVPCVDMEDPMTADEVEQIRKARRVLESERIAGERRLKTEAAK